MFGNLFKKKEPSYYLQYGPGTIVFTLPAKLVNHDPLNKVFTDEEMRALHELFSGGGRDVPHVYQDDEEFGRVYFGADFVNMGEVFWSDFDDLVSTLYGDGPGAVVSNPKGLIEVCEFEFFKNH